MARRQRPNQMHKALSGLWRQLQENTSREALGLCCFLVGGYVLFSLLVSGDAARVVYLLGWNAWLAGGFLLVLGAVLMVGSSAGYWNPEAVVGGEFVILGAAIGSFVRTDTALDWPAPVSGGTGLGDAGGIVGWGLGKILVNGLGRWPTGFIALVLLLFGVYLLLRHTPLIYLVPLIARREWPELPRRLQAALPGAQSRRAVQTAVQAPLLPIDPAESSGRDKDLGSTKSKPAAPIPEPPRAPVKQPVRRRPTSTAAPKPVKRDSANLPPMDLLDTDTGLYGNRDTARTEELIEQTLEDFNIPVKVVNVESGPTVTQYGVEPLYLERAGRKRKVRVSRIVSLADDLALALAASSVRIEAPVPGHPYVGIEVPNNDKILVGLRGLLESPELKKKGGVLPLGLGRDTAGAPVVTDLSRAPHMLIAGATGSGKSVCINTVITSLLMHHGPDSLRLVMVDPKMVELPGYNGIPHLIGNVITEMDHVVGALTWLLLQMDDRYQKFREVRVRNIAAYNEKASQKKSGFEPLHYLVLVVDELADLMMTAPEEVERYLVRLAQMARATGIHMILATQRPSTDVVTGLIKANFPTRIAFAVTSQTDSRVVLDSNGAEKLLGQGDMLFMRPDAAKFSRVQGCYVSDAEIERVVSFWKEWDREQHPGGPVVRVAPWIGLLDKMEDEESLIMDAVDLIHGMETCSTSFVQRKLRIGYPRAARLMEDLEQAGYVGPDLGGGQGRKVLVSDVETDGDEDEYDEGR